MDINKSLESKNQSMIDNSNDSQNSSNGYKQRGNAAVGIDKKRTKGKK
ncbi:hypothetical protein [Clostridium fallax]|uniref:Uncharacterized protein n=1 Tax=Clostridium fallax TaxID=1533 RepID=A0A1M4X112_9CLOT|nr:hypothetical protein [Clostridium fallax]SHE87179.1 hypothetical protein SAMN05443638_11537 [Clostridium fallax]SQB22556.1 Uncharacterised protein [Clostridium fallax]